MDPTDPPLDKDLFEFIKTGVEAFGNVNTVMDMDNMFIA